MSYASVGAFGQSCPGDEVFDATIGACTCPGSTQPTGTVGQCASAEASVPAWGEQCPSYVPIIRGFQCICPNGHAYDPAKNMCTKEAIRTGGSRTPPRIASATTPGAVTSSGLSTGAIGAGILAGFGLLYLWGQRSG